MTLTDLARFQEGQRVRIGYRDKSSHSGVRGLVLRVGPADVVVLSDKSGREVHVPFDNIADIEPLQAVVAGWSPESIVEPPVDPIPMTAEPGGAKADTLALWSPRGIGWASFFLGFPGGVVLGAMNWRRMGRTGKALVHLAAAVIGTLALLLVDAPRSVFALTEVAVAIYLYWIQRRDQAGLLAAGRVTGRSGLLGAAVALFSSILIVLPIGLVVVAVGDEYEHRGEVLFHTDQVEDCSPAAPVTVLRSSDKFFFTAVMRETVQPGSQVVGEVDGPGADDASHRVTVEPPFDCVVSNGSIGPLDPGIWVIRYRYADAPDTPDLAKGTLTITQSP